MDFSPEAIRDVAEAQHRVTCPGGTCTTVLSGHHLKRALAALEAADPHIRADERERWRAALADALDGLEDMFGYVPEFFQEKWGHQGYIDRARAALTGPLTEELAP